VATDPPEQAVLAGSKQWITKPDFTAAVQGFNRECVQIHLKLWHRGANHNKCYTESITSGAIAWGASTSNSLKPSEDSGFPASSQV